MVICTPEISNFWGAYLTSKNIYFGRTPYLQAVMFENTKNKQNIL